VKQNKAAKGIFLAFLVAVTSCVPVAIEKPSNTINAEPLQIPDTGQEKVEVAEIVDWQLAPVIPEGLSNRAREIYADGLELGRDPRVFSKVGDCGGTPGWFLGPFDIGPNDYRLGEYKYLEEVIAYFQGSYGRASLAVHDGFNAASILSPIRADRDLCEGGENPLACELRLNNPSIALIMIGTNDVYHVDEFEGRMRQIIEYTIDQGVLPVLASKPDNIEGDQGINKIIYKLALEYELPFWNLWLAFQTLPDQGLQEDDAHITFAPSFFDNEYVMESGWPWRNLTALQVLDFLWRELAD
jgi:hypothetical protein